MMCQLLGSSTNKAEVLSMEFFRIAWAYLFDGAEVPHSNTVTRSSNSPLPRPRFGSRA